ncbi:hypothetical protein [Tenacibaculum salmonis]|uniref:hypothetical protein n=1 Tax=Tenacibaculum sp. P3-BQ1 TaxID=3232310 RepID=UPI0034E026ED
MNNFDIIKNKCEEISEKIKKIGKENNENYVIDGIINLNKYLEAKNKILWILKEANSEGSSWSYINKFQDKKWLNKCGKSIPTIKRVMYTTYGILRNPKWENIPDAKDEKCFEPLQEIALLNIKKIPGGGNSNPKSITEAYNRNCKLLNLQVKTYNPDIIIFGNTFQYFKTADFPNIKETKREISTFGNHSYNTGDKLYIHTWHPAVRGKGFTDKGYVTDIIQIVEKWKSQNTL